MTHDEPYAANVIGSRASEIEGDGESWLDDESVATPGSTADAPIEPFGGPEPDPPLTVADQFGRAILRLRLFRGWSQMDVERASGVDQSQVSRLETGHQLGLSTRRVFAILRVLHVGEIEFLPPEPAVPPTDLELLLWGDRWERAGRAAERRRAAAKRRVSRRRSA
jgi:transcriptional regulator with XRE-family HTH domain